MLAPTIATLLLAVQAAPDATARSMFASVDANRDGFVDLEEMRDTASGPSLDMSWASPRLNHEHAMRAGLAPEDAAAMFMARLEDLDRDGDWWLTFSEWEASGREELLVVCPARRGIPCDAEKKNAETLALRQKSGRVFDRLDWWARRHYRFDSGLERPFYGAVRDYRAWHQLWDQIVIREGSRPVNPAVDFSKDMLLVAAMGTRPTGGYAIRIISVRDTGAELVGRRSEPFPASVAARRRPAPSLPTS